jgi:hypothetical protein
MKSGSVAVALLIILAAAGAVWAQPSSGPREPASPRSSGRNADPNGSCLDYRGAPKEESAALRTAPEWAKRTSDHVLTVRYRDGVHRFVDRMPYRDGLSGFHWSYCGYVPALKAHLIGVEDEDLFTGKLLFERSGRVIDAGGGVYPSPDGKLFLAASQVDGEYLSHWVLSDLKGRRLWAGISGVQGNPDIEYGAPVWIAKDVVRVSATCNDRGHKTGEATLARGGGTWRWKSDLQCKD